MNTTNKALIGVLALQGILALLLLSRSDSAAIGKLKPVLPGFDAQKLERIEIFKQFDAPAGATAAQLTPDITITKKDGKWVVSTYFDYPAGQKKLDTFFEKVSAMQSRGPIATAKARQPQLQVAEDKFLRKVVLHGQGQEPTILYVGQSAGAGTTAVRVHGSDAIYAVTGLTVSIAAPSVVGWVDTEYFRVKEKDVVSVKVENAAGTFAFERDGEGWKLAGDAQAAQPAQPAGAKAPAATADARPLNKVAIDTLARNMSLLQFVEPTDPEIPTGSPLAKVTLKVVPQAPAEGEDKPAEGQAVPASTLSGDFTFIIGPERNGRYIVRRTDLPPVAVSMSHLEPLVSFGPDKMYQPVLPQPAPTHGQQPAAPQGQQPAAPHGAQPAAPHGQQPAAPHGQQPAH